MKVLLVNPLQGPLVGRRGRIYHRVWPPLDLANCAALLQRDGIEADVLDAHAAGLGPSEVARRARGFDQVFVTSTSLDRWQCPHLDLSSFLQTMAAVREVAPRLFVLGSHGTVRPAEILEATGADAVVRGEPENTVREIAARPTLEGVRGITLLEDGEVVHRPDQVPVRLDELPLPALDRLPMDRYHYEVLGNRFTLFEMSRGCASDCTFCLLETYGVGVRKKSVSNLLQEIEQAVTQFGVRHAYFIDLEFTVLRKQVLELCQELVARRLPLRWCCQTRLDLVDAELLALMKDAGCRLIHTGVEGGSERILEHVDKGIGLEGIRRGMALIKQAGIETACFFMMGFPGATTQDMDDIVELAKELEPTYPLFHVTAPYPGTRLYDDVQASPHVRFSDSSLFPEAIEGPLTLRELKALTRGAYLRYYLRPRYLWGRARKGDVGPLMSQVRLFAGYLRG